MKKINWGKIQRYYDDAHTWNDIIEEFGVSRSTLYRASKNNIFISRNKSDAVKLYYKNNDKKHSEETKLKISKTLKEKNKKKNKMLIPFYLMHLSMIDGSTPLENYFSITKIQEQFSIK